MLFLSHVPRDLGMLGLCRTPLYFVRATDLSVPTFGAGINASPMAARYGRLMFVKDDVCVMVYETDISAERILWAGPGGCPCLPFLLFTSDAEFQPQFRLAVLLVTRNPESGSAFDATQVSMQHANGEIIAAEQIAGGRVRTKWGTICPLCLPAGTWRNRRPSRK